MTAKAKYDPKGQYVAVTDIDHPEAGRVKAGDPEPFSMAHRSPEEVEYLVDVVQAIKPAPAAVAEKSKSA